MVDHYLSEKEQIEQLKSWWNENGKSLVAGLVIGIGGLAGYRYWDNVQTVRSENASINYEHFLQMLAEGRSDDAVDAGLSIRDSYSGTTYANLSTLLLAKIAVDGGEYEQAKQYLRDLIDESGDGEIGRVARARLARILLAEGSVDEASVLVEKIPQINDQERFAELRGDILAASGNLQSAKTMYLQALAKARELGLERSTVQFKLDNLHFNAGDKGS